MGGTQQKQISKVGNLYRDSRGTKKQRTCEFTPETRIAFWPKKNFHLNQSLIFRGEVLVFYRSKNPPLISNPMATFKRFITVVWEDKMMVSLLVFFGEHTLVTAS